jgi:aminopeptidase
MAYHPSQEILDKYAHVLVNFALNGGQGIKRGELVFLQVPECAKPILVSLQKAVLKAGAHFITQYLPDDMSRMFYEHASDQQLEFFPDKYLRGRVDQMDHVLTILAETNKHELEGIDPKKIMARSRAFKPYQEWRNEKENQGKLTWTLALYGTEAMAREAQLTIEEYWQQIISACYLDEHDPIQKWTHVFQEVERVRAKLNNLEIEKVRVIAPDTDLTVGLGANRQWLGGSGRNIPSFEVFISPDARLTEGHIRFNQPLYRYGNLIKNVYLEFKQGHVVKATADHGQHVLQEMIATKGADRIGEFSLTDSRLSRITKFMAETLFDENIGGQFGNTHIALGNAYQDSYPSDPSTLTKEDWAAMGYNESVVHTDIISTENRTVTATLKDGTQMVIYKDGKFTI